MVAELEVLPQYREAFMPELRALVDGSRGGFGTGLRLYACGLWPQPPERM